MAPDGRRTGKDPDPVCQSGDERQCPAARPKDSPVRSHCGSEKESTERGGAQSAPLKSFQPSLIPDRRPKDISPDPKDFSKPELRRRNEEKVFLLQ